LLFVSFLSFLFYFSFFFILLFFRHFFFSVAGRLNQGRGHEDETGTTRSTQS
jgi:hypothetical protein